MQFLYFNSKIHHFVPFLGVFRDTKWDGHLVEWTAPICGHNTTNSLHWLRFLHSLALPHLHFNVWLCCPVHLPLFGDELVGLFHFLFSFLKFTYQFPFFSVYVYTFMTLPGIRNSKASFIIAPIDFIKRHSSHRNFAFFFVKIS